MTFLYGEPLNTCNGNMSKIQYNLMQFSKNGKTEAIVGFTDIHEYSIGGKFVRSVKIFDSVISPNSQLTDKDLLTYIADFFKKRPKN